MWIGFRCSDCGHETAQSAEIGLCDRCDGVRFARYDLKRLRGVLSQNVIDSRSPVFLRRFIELLPFKTSGSLERVFLGEQETPLVESRQLGKRLGIRQLQLKLDLFLPSGSLKDRAHSVTAAAAVERGADVIAISSSGNGASAVAAHAAKAGLKAVVGVFEDVPDAKLRKIRAYGPHLIRVPGGMDGAETAIRRIASTRGWFNAEAFVNPFNIEGEKSIGLEIAVQSGWKMPDVVALPLGNGAAVYSPFKAFSELHELGLIDRIPRIVGVQFSACAPIARAFANGDNEITPFQRTPSFSTTLMHEHPISGKLALEAVRSSGGIATSVSDDDVRLAMRLLALNAGLFAEPAGAISLAGIMKLRADESIKAHESVVCLVSGSGMNYPDADEPRGIAQSYSHVLSGSP